jgi:hypothetical protein
MGTLSNLQFAETHENLKGKSLDELLDEISVLDEWENQTKGLEGWFAVATDLGIIAYFGNEAEAYRFRLDYINRIINS